ncbi:ER membrane complex subunit 3 [Cichlidogyrus casuarinus]|uniref:ER membrane protein complex subunit 3 n=1 Tax=Cichlidogyrus casuarinus TaxID=1844966 RepID=A0ABD2PZ31_9PLAT
MLHSAETRVDRSCSGLTEPIECMSRVGHDRGNSKMAELLLDPNIRFWVFLPLVIITFLFSVIRHYLSILLESEKKPDFASTVDNQILMRSRLLRENGKYLTGHGFRMRKYYLNDAENGLLKTPKREANAKSPMADPSMMTDMLKGNMLNVIPMMVIGGWINWAFAGFLTTKIPFLLTYRFKSMLQRGCETLVSLDASWVSSASWYFLSIFGLRSLYSLVLGADNSADHSKFMRHEQMMSTQAAPDPQKAFKSEWEALELVPHSWALQNIEHKLFSKAPVRF